MRHLKTSEETDNPMLWGLEKSNRDFSKQEAWGKNVFNCTFPASLASYMANKGLENVYIKLSSNQKVVHDKISTTELFGENILSDNIFYSFESAYCPYQELVKGNLPRVDLVTLARNNGNPLRPLEIKLTALPDNSTCEFLEEQYGSELVIRPDTIVYLACSLAYNFKNNIGALQSLIPKEVKNIKDWSEGINVLPFIKHMISAIDNISLFLEEKQKPIMLQTIWKTIGKKPELADYCLDTFVWSDLAFIRLFNNQAKDDFETSNKISRPTRSIIWLLKMLYDFSTNGQFNHSSIIDKLSFNTKNDKAFALGGKRTRLFMGCDELVSPRIHKDEIKYIILGGGHKLLSPERRFDALIYNSPYLFDEN